MAASHASCFAMALNGTIGRKGGAASRTVVTATISADKGEAGIKLTTSKLHVVASARSPMRFVVRSISSSRLK